MRVNPAGPGGIKSLKTFFFFPTITELCRAVKSSATFSIHSLSYGVLLLKKCAVLNVGPSTNTYSFNPMEVPAWECKWGCPCFYSCSFLFASQRSTKLLVSELLPGCLSEGRGGTAVKQQAPALNPRPDRKCCGVAMQLCSPSARTLGSPLTNDVWCGQYGKPFEQALQRLYSKNRSRGGG